MRISTVLMWWGKVPTVHKWMGAALGVLLMAGVGGVVVHGFVAENGVLGDVASAEVEVELPRVQKVGVASPLRMTLPKEVDTRAVTEQVVLPEGVTGRVETEGRLLTVYPEKPLTLGQVLHVTLPATTLRTDGATLGNEVQYRFTVGEEPKVVAATPAPDAKEVPLDASITVTWDRAIVPLATFYSEMKAAVPEVTVTPATKGTWHWVGTQTLKFVSETPLLPATDYVVTVPAGLPTLAGEVTKEVFTLRFSTGVPQVLNAYDYEYQSAQDAPVRGPGEAIAIQFSQEVQLDSAMQQITLYKGDVHTPGDTQPVEVKRGEVRYGTVEVEEGRREVDRSVVEVVLPAALAFNAVHTVRVAEGVLPIQGVKGTEKEYLFPFRSPPPFDGVVHDVVEGRPYTDACMGVRFPNPVRIADVRKYVTLLPEREGWSLDDVEALKEDEKEKDATIQEVLFSCALQAGKQYEVRIRKGLTDMYGQVLEKEVVLSFTTADAEPKLTLHAGGNKGNFIFAERAFPPVLYFNAINVPKFQVKVQKVELVDVMRGWNGELSNGVMGTEKQVLDIPVQSEKNTWSIVTVDTGKAFTQPLESGVYRVEGVAEGVQATENNMMNNPPVQYFSVTDMGMTLKYDNAKVLAWVVDLKTGAPVAGATMQVLSKYGEVQATGTTDAAGFFEKEIDMRTLYANDYSRDFWVTAAKDGDTTFVSSLWNRGVQGWDFDMPTDMPIRNHTHRLESYVYTERQVYRPGDTVHMKGIVRLRNDKGIMTLPNPATQKIHIEVRDPKYTEILNTTVDVTEYGSFVLDMPVPADAVVGDWYVYVTVTPEGNIANNWANTRFAVLEYRKPEYKVELTTKEESYADGETVTVDMSGAYFFGAPLAGAPVTWRVQTMDYFFNRYTGDNWYSFALEDAWCWYDCARESEILRTGEGTLDAGGKMTLPVRVDTSTKAVSQVYTVEADVTDPNNQIVSGRASFVANKSEVYVGVRTLSWVTAPHSPAEVEVITLQPDGAAMANTEVTVQLLSRTWNSIRKKGVDGEFYFDSTPKDTFVREVKVKTDARGIARAELPVDGGGSYRVVAKAQDGKGRLSTAGTYLYVWDDVYVNWGRSNSDRMEVVADKQEYRAGDTAVLLVKSPYAGEGVSALVTVERESIMTRQVVPITSTAQRIEISITEEMAPNAFVSVVLVKPRQGEAFDEDNKDTGLPAFKVGYAKLNVDTEFKRAKVAITIDKATYGPGEEVVATIATTNSAGAPIRAEVSLGVVDMSLIALTGFTLPDLVKALYSDRALEVGMGQMLTLLGERLKPGSKGGGGSDPESKKRGNFKDTAYWNPRIVTNAKGVAEVRFTLPDNLTTWQLLGIAHTKEGIVGAEAVTVLETKKVIVRPVAPRFAVMGDKVTLGAIVQNTTDHEETFLVELKGAGFDAAGATVQQVSVKAGEQKKVLFPVVMQQVTEATFTYSAESGSLRDEVEQRIPVKGFGTLVTNATAMVVGDAVAEEQIAVPTAEEAPQGTVAVTLSGTLATLLPEALRYVREYAYYCAEQTVSAFLPSVAAVTVPGFEKVWDVSTDTLGSEVTSKLARLYTLQQFDGGFAYFENGQSNPYLSAYVVYGMHAAQEAGYTVDEKVVARAKEYLKSELRRMATPEGLKKEAVPALPLETRVFMLFALSESGEKNAGVANNALEQWENLSVAGRAELAMVMQKLGSTETAAAAKKITDTLISFVHQTARGAKIAEAGWQEWGTDDRTHALALMALQRVQPEHPMLPNLLRGLLEYRKELHWSTTQATAFAVVAMTEYLKTTNELNADYTATVTLSGKEVLNARMTQDTLRTKQEVTLALDALKRGALNDLTIAKTGAGKAYVDVVLSYVLNRAELPPAAEGMSILRELRPLTGKGKELKVGESYKVKLTISVPETRDFVAVESMLPAGFEIVQQRFATSQQVVEEEEDACDEHPYSEVCWRKGWWYEHEELRDDRVFLFTQRMEPGVYEYEYTVRATVPGVFHLRPTKIWEMYRPETFGQTMGGWLTITE